MKKKIILLLLLLVLLPVKAYALTGNTSISCSKTTLKPGESTTCSIKGTVSGDTVSAVDAKITAGSNLTVESVTPSGDWQGDKNDVNIVYYTSDNRSATFDIASVVIKASTTLTAGADVKLSLTATKFSSGSDYKETSINDSSANIRITSTVNTLSSLTVSNGTLTPTFNSNTLSYSVSTDEDKIDITATKTNDKSSITGDVGTKNLKYGTNTFSIKVTSESGVVKTYNLTVTRNDNRDTDNSLKTLTLNEKEIKILDNVVDYTYDVDNSVNQVVIESTLNSEKSSFVTGYGPRTVKLNEGKNKIEIKVSAENETVKTYTLTINRAKSATTNQNNTTTSSNGVSNPKTGSFSVYVITGILVVSLLIIGIIFFCKKKEEIKSETK